MGWVQQRKSLKMHQGNVNEQSVLKDDWEWGPEFTRGVGYFWWETGTESVKFEISGFWANLGRLTSLNLFPWLLKWRRCSYLTGSFQGLNEIKFVNDSMVFLVSLDLLPSKFNQFNQLMWSRWQRSGPQQTLKERQWEKERQGKDENKFIFAKLFSSNSLQITYQRIFNKVLVELSEVAIKQALLTRYWLPERNAVSSVLFPDARRQAEGNKSEKRNWERAISDGFGHHWLAIFYCGNHQTSCI